MDLLRVLMKELYCRLSYGSLKVVRLVVTLIQRDRYLWLFTYIILSKVLLILLVESPNVMADRNQVTNVGSQANLFYNVWPL